MLTVRKRGRTFHADYLICETRIRGSLGTRDQAVARRLVHRLETALSEGPASALWPELGTLLPSSTFARFANYVGVKARQLPTRVPEKGRFLAALSRQIVRTLNQALTS